MMQGYVLFFAKQRGVFGIEYKVLRLEDWFIGENLSERVFAFV
jgi:hypothetical protein